MSYQFARGMVVQQNTSIQIKQIRKHAKLPFVISFSFLNNHNFQQSKIAKFFKSFINPFSCDVFVTKSQQVFHIAFIINNIIIILVDAHKNDKSVHCVTTIAQQTWENFSFKRQKLMAGGTNTCRIQLSACLESHKGGQNTRFRSQHGHYYIFRRWRKLNFGLQHGSGEL